MKEVIPLGLKVSQPILKADRKVRTVLRLFATTLAFSLSNISVGKDSAGGLWSLPTLGQQQPEKRAILQNPPDLLHPDC